MIKSFVKEIFALPEKTESPLSREQKITNVYWFGVAFLLPFVIILAGASFRELAPFADKTLMAIDAWGQYFPMLREMKRAFRSFDFSYSFTGALGFDLTAQSAYYTNSPLWYILFLLPGELTPAQVDMMVFIRFGLAGLTFFYYISSHYGKKNYGMIFFAAAYSLSGYMLAFINQFMWMDAVILLPLVMLGIERIAKNERGMWLYGASLFLTIYSNFYIAFSVCLFSVLWFFVQTVCSFRGIRNWFVCAFRFGMLSLLAGLINLPVLIPLLRAISNTLASDMGFGTELEFYHTLEEMLVRLLPFQKVSLAFEAPNIYFGIIPAVFCIPAVFSKEKPIKKITYAALLVFMFVSFNFNLLDFIWHGFHFPNQLPGRQSFLFIFLGLVIGYSGFSFFTERLFRKEKLRRRMIVFLCVLICFELSANMFKAMATEVKAVPEASVLHNDSQMSIVRENYTSDSKENEFWRVELASHRYNGGQLYGYNGISHYSSTMSGACYKFFTQLGMSVYARNVSIEYIPNPVLNSLFGVRYIVSESPVTDEVSINAGMAENLYIHENTACLPLFYVGNREVLDVDMSLQGHAFANDIFKRLAGSEDVLWGNGVYDKDNCEGYLIDSQEFLKGISSILESQCEITHIGNTKITGTVNSVKDGVLVISLPAADVKIEIDGKCVETLTVAGYMAAAEITQGAHTVTIKLP